MEKDLFGNKLEKQISKLERALLNYDKESFNERLKRLEFINNLMENESGYSLASADTPILFDDAKNCFVFGQFGACILVCQSLLERCSKGLFKMSGDDKITKIGFEKVVRKLKIDFNLPNYLVKKLKKLRVTRNLLSHSAEDENSILLKAMKNNKELCSYLEEQAKDTLEITFEIIKRISLC